uniref:ATP synthase complex subunit 8 n=1 Tax=Tenebrionoidea sp. 2 KM-2017 TaxID=2219475 RepID=A0A346RJJ6_9CUCU|nr:ATP synthase F0 subunit 8 [Tenebrionoidea sp. 2 KM-2017]
MPQMAPLNWLTLMIYFILIFILFNSINYFSFLYNPASKSLSSKKSIQLNWKW